MFRTSRYEAYIHTDTIAVVIAIVLFSIFLEFNYLKEEDENRIHASIQPNFYY